MTTSKLHTLLAAYMAGDIHESELAKTFERAYNFEVDLNALSESERVAFSRLFDVLGLYVPSETGSAREAYPGYKSAADVRGAVRATLESLR